MRNRTYYIFTQLIICLSLLINININAQTFEETQKIVASDRLTYDNFGSSVSIFENTTIVGAPQKALKLSDNEYIFYAGAAYIYEIDEEENWVEKQILIPSIQSMGSNFGQAVDIFNNYAIIGSNEDIDDSENVGAAYIFEKNELGEWEEKARLVASDKNADDNFASSVCINDTFAFIGVPDKQISDKTNAGAVYIFKKDINNNWVEYQKLTASDANTNDNFGNSVSLDDNSVLIGAKGVDNNTGAAYFFSFNSNTDLWEEKQKVMASDKNSNDSFGFSVSISESNAIIGANNEDEDISGENTLTQAGSVYFFHLENNNLWEESQKIVANDRGSEDYFGSSVSLFQDYAVVGAQNEDEDITGNTTIENSGSAYYYKLNSENIWSQIQKIKASDLDASDIFGCSVDIFGNKLIIGALNESHDASGGNSYSKAGSCYLFNLSNNYLIKSTAGTGGKISPSGYNVIQDGDYITFNITPEDNYSISDILIDNTSIGTIQSSITITPTSDKTIEAIFDINTSITDPTLTNDVILYPNPAKDQITITSNTLSTLKNHFVYIIDSFGHVVKSDYLNFHSSKTITISELPPGTYFCKIKDCKAVKFTKK